MNIIILALTDIKLTLLFMSVTTTLLIFYILAYLLYAYIDTATSSHHINFLVIVSLYTIVIFLCNRIYNSNQRNVLLSIISGLSSNQSQALESFISTYAKITSFQPIAIRNDLLGLANEEGGVLWLLGFKGTGSTLLCIQVPEQQERVSVSSLFLKIHLKRSNINLQRI